MNRVVITGIGIITSIADSYARWIDALRRCEHNICFVPNFSDENKCPVAIVEKNNALNGPYKTLSLASIAFEEALAHSGNLQLEDSEIGLSFSSSTIGMPELEKTFIEIHQGKDVAFSYQEALSVGLFAQCLTNKMKSSVTSFSTACSSSANALGYAFWQVQQGRYKAVIAGGADALCRLTYHGFQSLKVMSSQPCIPFDKNRRGMNLGEGAGFVVLESLGNALERKAKIYGEVLGVGMSADGYHMSTPDPSGRGAALAMNRALETANIPYGNIECISAHGTGTIHNDIMESAAIHSVFQECAQDIYVHSLKSYLGHTLGAAGIISAISAMATIHSGFIPPTLGLEELDSRCPLKMVPARGSEIDVKYHMVNAFAFGGNNTSLVLGKYDA